MTAPKRRKDINRKLRERMMVVEREFPFRNYSEVYLSHYPGEDAEKIRLVWQLRATDETITSNFEKLLKKLTAKAA